MDKLHESPEAMAKLRPLFDSLREKERRCAAFYSELEQVYGSCEAILASKVLAREQEDWLKWKLSQL